MELNWKEFFIGAVATIIGIPLLAIAGMGTVDQYAKWSRCSDLTEIAEDDTKRQYLQSLVHQWSLNEELFQRVKSEHGFLFLAQGEERYGQTINWRQLSPNLEFFATGARFVGEKSLLAVRFEEVSRAVGNNHITVLVDNSSAPTVGSEIIAPHSVKVTDRTYVYCENWH